MGKRYVVYPQKDEGTVVSWSVRELGRDDEAKPDEITIDDRDAAWRVAWALSAYEHAIKNRPPDKRMAVSPDIDSDFGNSNPAEFDACETRPPGPELMIV